MTIYLPQRQESVCADSSFRWNVEKKINYVILNRSETVRVYECTVRFGGER